MACRGGRGVLSPPWREPKHFGPAPLICIERRQIASRTALGWRAYLAVDDEVALYYPRCAEREFGQDENS
jgi:hypothetical protein